MGRRWFREVTTWKMLLIDAFLFTPLLGPQPTVGTELALAGSLKVDATDLCANNSAKLTNAAGRLVWYPQAPLDCPPAQLYSTAVWHGAAALLQVVGAGEGCGRCSDGEKWPHSCDYVSTVF